MKWIKKKVWVVTVVLKSCEEWNEKNEHWTDPTEEYYAETKAEAVLMRECFLRGENAEYGDLIVECYISDEAEEHEFLI